MIPVKARTLAFWAGWYTADLMKVKLFLAVNADQGSRTGVFTGVVSSGLGPFFKLEQIDCGLVRRLY